MAKLRRILTLLVCLALPHRLKPFLLRLIGHKVANGAIIGCSLVLVDRLLMERGARIGFGNLVQVPRVVLRTGAYIQNFNMVSTRAAIVLAQNGAIGNRNQIKGAPAIGRRRSLLSIGLWSKITAGHVIDVSESIIIGNFSTIAGAGTQIWTHGFVHMSEGVARAAVRGSVRIGNNVYIGSMSCLSPGIVIASKIAVGAHSSVSASLLLPGVYVSQKLRYIEKTPEERLAGLVRLPDDGAQPAYWRAG